MSVDPVVWHGSGATYHATPSCAGHDAVPVFEVFVADSTLSPCGVCQPGERYRCEECDSVYKYEKDLQRHRVGEHVSTDSGERDQRLRDLDAKARGETDD